MLSLALKLENRAGSYSWPATERMWAYLAASARGAEDPAGPADKNLSHPPIPPILIDLFSDLSPLIEDHRDLQLAVKIAAFAGLPPGLKTMVAEGQVDLKSAARVQDLPEEVFAGLQASSLSFSQRRQFLNELFEVSRKGELSQPETSGMAERAFRDQQPLESIRRLRFPTLTALEKRFANLEEQLLKGSGVQLKPPPYFEGENFTVEFRFNTAKSFNRKLSTIQSLEGSLDALFELLH
jgi:hypothetical protein